MPEEMFQRIELADGRTALRSVTNGKCVTARNDTQSYLDVDVDCTPDDVRQQFTIEPTRTGAVRIRQSAGDRYITPGSDVYLRTRYPSLNMWQLWDLLPA